MALIDKLKTGDVVYVSCIDVPFCYHLGIVYDDGEKKLIYHNSPYNKNKYGGSVCAESYDVFVKDREVIKVVETHVTNDEILRVSRKCKEEIWDTFFFNCEDYILELVDGHRRSDVRDAWKIGALGILIIIFM